MDSVRINRSLWQSPIRKRPSKLLIPFIHSSLRLPVANVADSPIARSRRLLNENVRPAIPNNAPSQRPAMSATGHPTIENIDPAVVGYYTIIEQKGG